MRGLLVVACTLVALAAAPAARAEVTIGSTLAPPANFAALSSNSWTVSPTSPTGLEVIAPSSGVITRWRVRAGQDSEIVRLVVIRRPQGAGNNPGFVVTRSAPADPSPNAVSTFETRIPIAAGDYIGIECCFGAGAGAYIGIGAGVTDVWDPALGLGATAAPTAASQGFEALVNADIEPDADGDEVGDESQDNCVGVANAGQADRDRDGRGDACDTCPAAFGPAPDGCPPAPPATPRVNTPPVVRFRSPLAGTAVRVSQTIELDVSDDAGNPTVTVFDDDGTVCALSGPPYSCTWRPTGADVGRATLLASAVDSDNRSTLGIVRVTVARFEADLTRRVRGRRVTGRLMLPAAVEKALGCRGEVTVRRGRTTREVALKRNCAYSARLPRGRGRVRARFAGNPVVEPAR